MGGVLDTVGKIGSAISPVGFGTNLLGGQTAVNAAGGGGGGKKGGGNAPSTPDFAAAATPNQTNAFGVNSQWSKGPDGRMSQNQSFSGPLAGLSQGLQGQAASAWGQPLDNGAQARQHAQDAIYGQETSRLDPQWQQRQHDFQTQLANQGIDPNSAAYSTAQGNFDRGRNDAYQQANYGSVIGGGQEAQRQQQMDLQSRFAPLQGLQGLAGLTGQSQNPLLPAAIAQYQGGLQKYGIDQAGKNSTMGGLAGLGGTLGSAYMLAPAIAAGSDERIKYDVQRHPTKEVLPGVPEATFKYRDDPAGARYVGVIAQDVERAGYGHLVTEKDGIKMVHGSLAPRLHGS